MALDADTLKQLLDTVGRFVEQRLRPLEFKVAEDDAIPAEIAGEMRDMGLLSACPSRRTMAGSAST